MHNKKMKVTLTIAGSDSSGGAGIQADLKAMSLNGVFAESAITALTAQNTTGVRSIMDSSEEFLKDQIDSVFEDIRPDAIKIGMVSKASLIEVIGERLAFYKAENIVLDPVMVATSGSKLLDDGAIDSLKRVLIPKASLITPNIPEAEILIGCKIKSEEEMVESAKKIYEKYQVPVLLKGGHMVNDANDYLYDENGGTWIKGERIDNPNTHGTGCTLSSAIAANLAKGHDLKESIKRAKTYLEGALKYGLDLGEGSGPMNHAFDIKDKYKE